jgi:hypothetical protein
MDIAAAQQFLRENENAVLATWRRDGRLQMSPVTVGLDGAVRAIISSNETTYESLSEKVMLSLRDALPSGGS